MARVASLWHTSRASSGVSRSFASRPISGSVSRTRSSATMLRNGDWPSWTASACASVASNTGSPVLFSKPASRIGSRSESGRGRLASASAAITAASASAMPQAAQNHERRGASQGAVRGWLAVVEAELRGSRAARTRSTCVRSWISAPALG